MTDKKTEKSYEKREYEKREYKERQMIKIFGVDVDEVKKILRNDVNVIVAGKDVNVFSTSYFTKKIIKEKLPDAKFEVVSSDKDQFQNSFKIQSALAWKKFKSFNVDYVEDTAAKIFVTIRSNPFDASKPELATKFVKEVAERMYSGEISIKCTIRGWLLDAFKELYEKKELKNTKGKQVDLKYYRNREPMRFPKDKALIVKFYATVADVEGILKQVEKFERCPQCNFSNPEYLKKKDWNKINQRKEDRRQGMRGKYEKPERKEGEKAPFIKGKRDDKKRDDKEIIIIIDGDKKKEEK